MRIIGFTAFAILLSLGTTGSARADGETPSSVQAAEALFQSGRAAMDRGDFTTACAQFAESQRLDPAPGTLLNLAECEAHSGKLAAGLGHFKEARGLLAASDFRLAMADQRIADLARRVPRLAVRLLSEPSGVHVVCDGVDVAPASLGVALAVDPGRHACIVHAPGHEDGHAEVTLGEGEQKTLEIALGPMVSSGPHQASPGQQDRAPVATGATQRILGLVTGGVGVGAVAVGAVFGFVAKGTYDDAMAACNGTPRPCQGSGVTEGQTAHDQARLATGAFVVGTVLLAGGAVLYLTAPKPKATALAPAVGTREAGVVLRGTW